LSAADIKPFDRVIDIGAGTGNSRAYAGAGASWLLVDQIPAMLRRARRKFVDDPRVQTQRLDFTDPRERDNIVPGYSVCLSVNALYCDPDPVGHLTWLHRIAAPAARLVLAGPWQNGDMKAIIAEHRRQRIVQQHKPRIWWLLIKNLPVYLINRWYLQPRMTTVHSCPASAKQLASWLNQAGWQIMSLQSAYAGTAYLVLAHKQPEELTWATINDDA
jgi:SAM-dependent methyltransferase